MSVTQDWRGITADSVTFLLTTCRKARSFNTNQAQLTLLTRKMSSVAFEKNLPFNPDYEEGDRSSGGVPFYYMRDRGTGQRPDFWERVIMRKRVGPKDPALHQSPVIAFMCPNFQKLSNKGHTGMLLKDGNWTLVFVWKMTIDQIQLYHVRVLSRGRYELNTFEVLKTYENDNFLFNFVSVYGLRGINEPGFLNKIDGCLNAGQSPSHAIVPPPPSDSPSCMGTGMPAGACLDLSKKRACCDLDETLTSKTYTMTNSNCALDICPSSLSVDMCDETQSVEKSEANNKKKKRRRSNNGNHRFPHWLANSNPTKKYLAVYMKEEEIKVVTKKHKNRHTNNEFFLPRLDCIATKPSSSDLDVRIVNFSFVSRETIPELDEHPIDELSEKIGDPNLKLLQLPYSFAKPLRIMLCNQEQFDSAKKKGTTQTSFVSEIGFEFCYEDTFDPPNSLDGVCVSFLTRMPTDPNNPSFTYHDAELIQDRFGNFFGNRDVAPCIGINGYLGKRYSGRPRPTPALGPGTTYHGSYYRVSYQNDHYHPYLQNKIRYNARVVADFAAKHNPTYVNFFGRDVCQRIIWTQGESLRTKKNS